MFAVAQMITRPKVSLEVLPMWMLAAMRQAVAYVTIVALYQVIVAVVVLQKVYQSIVAQYLATAVVVVVALQRVHL